MQRKIHNFDSVVLVDLTLEKEGYHPDKYGISSAKFIWATCRFCGEPARVRKCFYKRAESACHQKCRLQEQSTIGSPFKSEEVRNKAKKTVLSKYGTEYVSQNAEVARKISKTLCSYGRKNSVESIVSEIKDCLNVSSKCKNNHGLHIFLHDNKFGIHINSNQLDSEQNLSVDIAKKVHWNRFKYCQALNIRLFQVFEHQWNRKKQILNFIKTILGVNDIKVAARKCEVDHSDCASFFNGNHIQGYGQGTIKFFNLTLNGEIVASMTASKHHRQNTLGNPIVLNRLCFKDGVNVQGGSSKLFKYFLAWAKEKSYDRILSWSDNCWTEGNIYKVLGFKLEKEYPPDYFYWNCVDKIIKSKQSQKKGSTGCPDGMTERDWCIQRNLWRVWDCGKRLWVYDI